METAKFFQTEYIDDIFNNCVVIKDGIPLPLEIELTLSDSCNRNCKCCPRGNEDIAPNTNLEVTQFLYKKIAKELKELSFKGLIMLGGYGEPLLHKDIIDIVKEFNFTFVGITTNGDLLTDSLLKDIINAGVHMVSISVYEERLLKRFFNFAKIYSNKIIVRNRYEEPQKLFNNRAGTLNENKRGGVCYYPFYMVNIDSNGDCFPCCHEWQRRLKIGNIYQHTIWEVWTSNRIKEIRRKILEGNRDLYPCRICNVDGTYKGGQAFELFTK